MFISRAKEVIEEEKRKPRRIANLTDVDHNDIVYKSKKTEQNIEKLDRKRKPAKAKKKTSQLGEGLKKRINYNKQHNKKSKNKRINSSSIMSNDKKYKNKMKQLDPTLEDKFITHPNKSVPGMSGKTSDRKSRNKKQSQVKNRGLHIDDYDYHDEDVHVPSNNREISETNEALIQKFNSTQQDTGLILHLVIRVCMKCT